MMLLVLFHIELVKKAFKVKHDFFDEKNSILWVIDEVNHSVHFGSV